MSREAPKLPVGAIRGTTRKEDGDDMNAGPEEKDGRTRQGGAAQLAEGALLIGNLPEGGDQVRRVEGVVRIREAPCVAPSRDDVEDAQFLCSTHGAVEHLQPEVEDVERASRSKPSGNVEAVVASARPDLEDPLAGFGGEHAPQAGAGEERARKLEGEPLAVRAGRGVLAPT
jgi:hypothetical protein